MSILVTELPDLPLPEEFIELIPVDCPNCSSPMQISEALTGLSCTNPHCGGKVSERIASICSKLQIKNFGISRINKFIDYYEITNPMDIFDLQPGMALGEGIGDGVAEGVIDQIINIRENSKFRLHEAVALCNLPGIQTTARKLFHEFDDIDEAYEALHDGGLIWVHNKLFAKQIDGEYGVTIASIKAYDTLIRYEDQVKEGVSYLNIVSNDLPELDVVVSDSVGGDFRTKPEFYNYLKENYSDRFAFNFGTSVNKNITVLIWAGADGSNARYTSKVSKVERYNEAGHEIPILTGTAFVEFLNSGRDIAELYNFYIEVNEKVALPDDIDFDEEYDDASLTADSSLTQELF